MAFVKKFPNGRKGKYIQVTEGQLGQLLKTREIEVCMDCEENIPLLRSRERICRDCYDGRGNNWIK